MKQATCKQLRGACDTIITGTSAEEMAENCKAHVSDMLQDGDESHKIAVNEMMSLSKENQQKWYEEFLASFDSLPEA